ncbi:MAG TPA: hypothetical protein PLJ71_21250 [Candidatus Hydrogenedentes bacterium]|nr:hypothetical protein [Candidatus Hydrogenedentota bacterium]HQM51216.1 hypothetical protein [Candidatus Hydrogenedentota bacterium]
MKRALPAAVALLLVLGSCGEEETAPQRAEPSEMAQTGAGGPVSGEMQRFTRAPVMVVDLEGRPLANMLPLATDSPNAFQKPVVQGELTGSGGTSELSLPRDRHLYVRAWDPALRMFPNNFYEVLPPTGDTTETMTITMVEGATLAMTLLDANQNPAANENVGLMMFHGVHGAWWPAEGNTDENGRVQFALVPPGEYTVKVKAVTSGQLELGSVRLSPGGKTDLGPLTLQ